MVRYLKVLRLKSFIHNYDKKLFNSNYIIHDIEKFYQKL